MSLERPFEKIRARFLFLVFVIGNFLGIVLLPGDGSSWEEVRQDVSAYLAVLIGLLWLCQYHQVRIARLVGTLDFRVNLVSLALSVVLPIIVFSIGSLWLIFLPISYIWPAFVDWWLIDKSSLLIWVNGELPLAPNAVMFLHVVVLVPICEELLFRGLLLHRWSHKWGTTRGILYSSLLFGIGHSDVLGSFIFGFVMAVIYIQTRTLVLPIVAHAMNNMLAWNLELLDTVLNEHEYTLADFQSEWWLGFGCLVLSLPWLVQYVRKNRPSDKWQLPYYA